MLFLVIHLRILWKLRQLENLEVFWYDNTGFARARSSRSAWSPCSVLALVCLFIYLFISSFLYIYNFIVIQKRELKIYVFVEKNYEFQNFQIWIFGWVSSWTKETRQNNEWRWLNDSDLKEKNVFLKIAIYFCWLLESFRIKRRFCTFTDRIWTDFMIIWSKGDVATCA